MKIHWLVILGKTTVMRWWDDNALRLSAALSYYTLFSLAPVLTIAIAFAGLVVDEKTLREEVRDQSQGLIGKPGADAIAQMLESAGRPVQSTPATIVGLVTLVIVSTGMFSELQDALNLIWRTKPKKSEALWNALKSRIVSFILVVSTGAVLLGSLLVSTFLAALGKFVVQAVPWPQVMLIFLDVAVSLPVITLLFALLFKVLPDGYIAWRDVWLGAVATGMFFIIGKWAIGLYLGSTAMTSMYGAASSLMMILAWVYYSALIFFLGAELTCTYANAYGSRVSHQKLNQKLPGPVKITKA